MTTITDIYDNLRTPYEEKQQHRVPDFPVVDREAFILERCAGKVVLDIGASGPMHEAIVGVAKKCYGIDRERSVPGPEPDCSSSWVAHTYYGFDLDSELSLMPTLDDVEQIVCGEVIEHLANPGNFLQRLREVYPGTPIIITVPNAASSILQQNLRRGIESVNNDHVAWYSWKTLSVLLGRYGYRPTFWAWYNGEPRFAEGIVCVAE